MLRTPVRLTSGVRPSVFLPSFSGKVLDHGASAIRASSSAAFFSAQALVIFPGTALIIAALCNLAVWPVSIWLSALRQPAHRNSAPKCHAPSPCWLPVLRQSAINRGMRLLCMHISRSAVSQVRPAISSLGHVRHNSSQSHKGSFGVHRSNANQQSTARFGSSSGPSRPSLTCRSSRHPQVSLVGSLRASRSGAAYLWR